MVCCFLGSHFNMVGTGAAAGAVGGVALGMTSCMATGITTGRH